MVRRSSHDVIGESALDRAMDKLSFVVRLIKVLHHKEYERDYASNTDTSIDGDKCVQSHEHLLPNSLSAFEV